MCINHMISQLVPTVTRLLLILALTQACAHSAVVESKLATGDGTLPGGVFVTSGNLLSSDLLSSSRTGTFYREDSGYVVDLSRLSDGVLGPLGSSGLGGDGAFTVMPGVATIQFDFAGAFNLTSIRTYASWDDGRSGQGYEVQYATSADPLTFISLHTVANWNTPTELFPTYEDDDQGQTVFRPDTSLSSTLTSLTSSYGFLAEDVVSVKFVFSGYQNNGTAYREFQVEGSSALSALSAVPEPSGLLALAGLVGAATFLRQRRAPLAL